MTSGSPEKSRARDAYRAALEAEPGLKSLIDRWWSTALTTADAHPARANDLYRRTAILMEILTDMRSWPAGRIR